MFMAYRGAIFDVDGVLVDSPHELAWREALKELMEGDWRAIRDQTSWTAERFTPAVYQQVMAGKPRMAGAQAALEYFGVPDLGGWCRTVRHRDGCVRKAAGLGRDRFEVERR
jgi:FMN phosphatase YigB (HAD superfamily)